MNLWESYVAQLQQGIVQIFGDYKNLIVTITVKGVRKGRVLGLTPPLEHDIFQNFITYAKEINCFRILFAC